MSQPQEVTPRGDSIPEKSSGIAPRFLFNWRFALTSIFLLAVALYFPVLQGWAIWDDHQLLTLKATFGISDVKTAFTHPLFGNYFRPLTSLSFVIENGIFKGIPFYYHLTNLLLHAVTAVLVAFLVLLVTRRRIAGVLAGIFFAVQPAQVGAAAWIGGRPDVLSLLFLVLFLIALVMYHDSQKGRWLVIGPVLLLLAALTKEQALAFWPLVPLSAFTFGSSNFKGALKVSAPYAFILVVYAGLWMIGHPSIHATTHGLSETVVLMLRTVSHYAMGFIVPTRSSVFTFTLGDVSNFVFIPLGALVVTGSVWALRLAWKRSPILFWFGLAAVLGYVPVSNFTLVGTLIAAPYRCAIVGLPVACILGMAGAFAAAHRRVILALPLGLNFILSFAVTWEATQHWHLPFDFWQEVYRDDPHFLEGAQFYAHSLDDKGLYDESVEVTSKSLTYIFDSPQWAQLLDQKQKDAITPGVGLRLEETRADLQNLGNFMGANAFSLGQAKRYPEATVVARDALILSTSDYWLNYYYGRLILKTDRVQAIRHWEVALRLNPDYYLCGLALAHQRLIDHEYADASRLLEHALALYPVNGYAWLDMVDAKVGLKDRAGAENALQTASNAELKPNPVDLQKREAAIRGLTESSPSSQPKA